MKFWPILAALRDRPHFLLLLCGSILLPGMLFVAYAVQSREAAFADIEDRMSRRTAFLAEHAGRVFDAYTLMFDSVEHLLAQGVSPEILNERAHQMVARTDFTGSLLIVDRTGRIIGGSMPDAFGLDVADREYFTAPFATPGIVVSGRIVGRISNRDQFGLSKRTVVGHVVAAMVRSLYFERIFGTLAGQDGLDAVVGLYRSDGSQLVRYPRPGSPVNLRAGSPGLMSEIPKPSGIYRVARPLGGGGERIYSFHQVQDFPLYVTYGITISDALAPWRASMLASGLLAMAAAAMLAGGVLVVIRRVEEVHRTEAKLQEIVAARTAEAVEAIRDRETALLMAERAHNAKAHFLAAASHDLRQPIQALRLFLEVLKARLLDPDNGRILGHASDALKGAEDLLGALLDVSTLDAGMVAANRQPVELSRMLGSLATEFETLAHARFLHFHYVPTSAWVETDPVLLSRMLRNLLTNALRYTLKGGVLLGCRRAGGEVLVQVWDTGAGIPADKLETVFEDFIQLDNPERDRSKGLGLGLAVVRRMAVLLAHPVNVQSVEGKGTVFSIRLRRCEPQADVEAEGDMPSALELSPV